MNTRHKQNGFTVIELLIVIGIITVGILTIVNRVQSARQSSQVSSEAGNLSAIVSKTQSAFAGRPNFAGLTTAVLLAQNAFPAQMVNTGVVTHTWGGTVTVTPETGNTSFNITYSSVPAAACIEFVSTVSRSFNEVTINSAKTKDGAEVADLDDIVTSCGSTPATVVFNAS